MQIQRPISVSQGNSTQNVSFPDQSGGTSPGAGEGVRADWSVRMNVSHSRGFVGGAGRVLIHNEVAEDRDEISLYLPAARSEKPGTLEVMQAVVCSAKPGLAASAGQNLVLQTFGARVAVTIPLLKLGDWIYIDLTWSGSFPINGAAFSGAQIPLGDFHPQIAIDVPQDDGRQAIFPVAARYEVTLGSDVGASVRLDDGGTYGKVITRLSDDGQMSEHEFKSYGKPHIQALLAAPGAVLGAPVAPAAPAANALPTTPASTLPGFDASAPRRP